MKLPWPQGRDRREGRRAARADTPSLEGVKGADARAAYLQGADTRPRAPRPHVPVEHICVCVCARARAKTTCAKEASATFPSAVRNEERRRAWRASRENKLQPLPSCEAW